MKPDNPKVVIEIRGEHRAGKSSIAALVKDALSQLGIKTTGPDEIIPPAYRVPGAFANLKQRGLTVEIIETRTGEIQQIDARIRR